MLTLYKKEEQSTIKKSIKLFLESMLKRQEYTTWIVLEPSRDEEIKFFIDQYEDVCHYLFNDDDEELQEAGAVALCLNEIPEVIAWITEHWGKNWFNFFVTKYDTVQVIAHMSSLCYLSSNEKMYLFRYYEPVTFACWVSGLKEVKRVDEALGLFSEVYVETPLPHMLMQYAFNDNIYKQYAINLEENLKGFSLPLPKEEVAFDSLDGHWYMGQKEYEFLTPVSLNAFKIKLCKNLLQEYHLLDTYTLTEVYSIINKEVARATRYGIIEKHLLAQFVKIRFAYPEFWKEYEANIEKTLSFTNASSVDRMEKILEAVDSVTKGNI
jgi:hypothetical protein